MLIPGLKGLGNDIDTYLQPLIDDLKELWEVSACTYDISTKQNFQMRAAVLWIVNDFLAYVNLSGWSTKGKLACPYCASQTCFRRLSHGSKFLLYGTLSVFPKKHNWCNQKKEFDGKT